MDKVTRKNGEKTKEEKLDRMLEWILSNTAKFHTKESAGKPLQWCVFTVIVAYWSPSSELIDRSLGRAETTSHTTHQGSEATASRLTSCIYLLLREHRLDTH